DRKQDRLVGGLGGSEHFVAPRLPMHGIVLVLEEIGARLLAEAVAVHRGSCRAVRRDWAVDALPSAPRQGRVGILVQETADCVIRSAGPNRSGECRWQMHPP